MRTKQMAKGEGGQGLKKIFSHLMTTKINKCHHGSVEAGAQFSSFINTVNCICPPTV